MIFTRSKTLLFLGAWFVLCAALYFPAVRANLTFVPSLFALFAGVFFVLFLLTNGGSLPLLTAEGKEPEKMRGRTRANPFRLAPQKQAFVSRLFLLLFCPMVLVFFLDYLLILLQEYVLR